MDQRVRRDFFFFFFSLFLEIREGRRGREEGKGGGRDKQRQFKAVNKVLL